MNRIIMFIIGLIMASIGLSYIIMKLECIIFFIGYMLILLSIIVKRRKKNDIHV